MTSCTDQDAIDIVKFINEKNKLLSQKFMMPAGHYSLQDVTQCATDMFSCLEPKLPELRQWCIDTFKKHQSTLWMIQMLAIGINFFRVYDRYGSSSADSEDFYKNQFDRFSAFKNYEFRTWKSYKINYDDAVQEMEHIKEDARNLPEVRAIHDGRECQYGDWWDDECTLCWEQRRKSADYIDQERAKSENIFVNVTLDMRFLYEWLQSPENAEPMKHLWKKWVPVPIMEINHRPYKFIHSSQEVIISIQQYMTSINQPGITAIVFGKKWADHIFLHHMNFRDSLIGWHLRNENRLELYITFFKCFHFVDLFPKLIPIFREHLQIIQDML